MDWKIFFKKDIREFGSHSSGTTNTFRVLESQQDCRLCDGFIEGLTRNASSHSLSCRYQPVMVWLGRCRWTYLTCLRWF
ncbi:MAG: hypothetical protein ACLTW7_16255 [Enterococcus sp.]|uniref:hypothetical protein n=1 Tax=Enterococcus sp. TaxID=35783 RepID=UPI00399161F7